MQTWSGWRYLRCSLLTYVYLCPFKKWTASEVLICKLAYEYRRYLQKRTNSLLSIVCLYDSNRQRVKVGRKMSFCLLIGRFYQVVHTSVARLHMINPDRPEWSQSQRKCKGFGVRRFIICSCCVRRGRDWVLFLIFDIFNTFDMVISYVVSLLSNRISNQSDYLIGKGFISVHQFGALSYKGEWELHLRLCYWLS